MKKISSGTWLPVLIASVMITATGCQKTDNSAPASKYAVSISTDATLGQYLVDKNNQTLYFFSNDYKGLNSCSGGCAAFWPYFFAGTLTTANLGPGLNLSDFKTIDVNGVSQTTYKGWPLYYYAPQGTSLEPRGEITGEAVSNWFVAKPDYTVMLAYGQLVGNDGKDYLDTYAEGTGNTLYFTDANGATLYTFSPDSFDINKFTKADFSNNAVWPIYDTTKIVVPSFLDKTEFHSITVHGRKQLVYKGWPLYYFGADNKVQGNTKGVSVPVPGKWPVGEKGLISAPQK